MGIIREPDIGDHDARGQGAESRFAAAVEAEAGGPFTWAAMSRSMVCRGRLME